MKSNYRKIFLLFSNLIKASRSNRNYKNYEKSNPEKSYYASAKLLRDKRESLNMQRLELAYRTRITSSVIEAIENGWTKKLPERAYLSSMLKKIEYELGLERGSLKGILNSSDPIKNTKGKGYNVLNIDKLARSQVNIVYIVMMYILIISLNHQQRDLAKTNSLTFYPVSPMNESERKSKAIKTENSLNKNQSSILSSILTRFSSYLNKNKSYLLEVKTNESKDIIIKKSMKDLISIKNVSGYTKLNLAPPLSAIISPNLKSDEQLIWDGKEIKVNKSGVYKLK